MGSWLSAWRAGLVLLVFAGAKPLLGVDCPGDCDGDGQVTIEELVSAVGIALGSTAVDACPNADPDGDGEVTIDTLVAAVGFALNGCPANPPPTPTPEAEQIPPYSAAELEKWLRAGRYSNWLAESSRHPSGGPHGGNVRVFLNDILADSLAAGNPTHPRGAAVVKELYFSAATVREWAVMIKLDEDSGRGNGWYWYEGEGLSGRGLGICSGCHEAGYRSFSSRDFVLTPFPLR